MPNPRIKVRFHRLTDNAITPEYAHDDDSGADVFCTEPVSIQPGKLVLVGTGISVELPEGWELQVRSKSGLAAKKGVMVLNSPGTIDESYRLEIKVILHNTSDEVFQLPAGSKIAQLVLAPVWQANYVLMDDTQRSGGMGSTGLVAKEQKVVEPILNSSNVQKQDTPTLNIAPGFAEGLLSLSA
jgi:dUTP pyrophosphatase